ncbi:MAG: HAD-IIIA family hydrolase [Deltaproteobacteria bacterium]|nr:HAD-IIIA family hydrolase [Candidatus Anaeroferrophillus wilburensis]MBN2889455.1 HAD-IIIA family hydrolase [Deltaproteobacteria bacterium]
MNPPKKQPQLADSLQQRLLPLRGLVMDVDGVLTDGRIIINDRGEESKHFHVRDGHGIKLLLRTGFQVALLTGRQSQVVLHRARELGIDTVFQKIRDKVTAYEQIKARLGLADQQICYVGDDLVDIPVLRRAGLAATVADGIAELDQVVHWRASLPGGGGAVRELCELIMHTQQTWEAATERYFGQQ